jgi:dTDP-glucose 4,6-dehydratase
MKLFITGGAGFIGSNFVHYWVKHHPEDEIVVFDKLTYAGNLANLEPVKEKISFVRGDIADKAAVAKAMAGSDTVVHFAAESHVDRSILDPQSFVHTNIVGTQVLLEAAHAHHVTRFHHISTDEVLGQLPLESKERWTETSPYQPRSPYAASKAASDHLVRAYNITYGLPVTITNAANNVGPYMFPEKFIPLGITNILEGKKVPVYRPGNQVREWLYVDDHCSGIEAVLQKGQVGETYFISPDNEELSNLEVMKKVLQLMNASDDQIELVGDRPGHDQKYAIDHSKITKELGWTPKYKLGQTLQLMVDWYSNNQDWWKNVKNGDYQKYYEQQYGKR